MDSLNAERRKEIDDLLSSTSSIPKAPWDEGVCKVCGIDRDDDSVLLCDTCDAEYHTYCLNPPLARIPEGNWYCPSCVGKRMVQDGPKYFQVMRQRSGKKYQGEVTRVYLEALARLAAKMEEKEYWELTVYEVCLLTPVMLILSLLMILISCLTTELVFMHVFLPIIPSDGIVWLNQCSVGY